MVDSSIGEVVYVRIVEGCVIDIVVSFVNNVNILGIVNMG